MSCFLERKFPAMIPVSRSFSLMSHTVLLLLSVWMVQCDGCDFDLEGVKNIKAAIDSNPTGFVSQSLRPRCHHKTNSAVIIRDYCCLLSIKLSKSM